MVVVQHPRYTKQTVRRLSILKVFDPYIPSQSGSSRIPFGRIRRCGGWNNNPNILQFKYALRSVLMKNGVLASSKGNCVSLRTVPVPENSLCNLDCDSENPDLVHVHQSSDFALRSPKYDHFVSSLFTKSP